MPASPFGIDDFLGRTIRLIGNRQGISLAGADNGAVTNVFNTGDTWFPAGLLRVVIAYVIVTGSGSPFDAGVGISLGSLSSPDDWGGGTIDLSSLSSPVTLYPNIALTTGLVTPIVVYATGTPIVVTNRSSGPTVQTGTVSCYGWPEN